MSDVVVEMVGRQRRRLVASILGHAEREFYESLSVEQREAFRGKVLASVGVFADFVIDVVRAGNGEGLWVNEEAMELLVSINEQVRNLALE